MKTAVSLFSGIGGLDEGIHRAGFDLRFCSEIDKNAMATLEQWCSSHNQNPLFCNDINSTTPAVIRKKLGLKKRELDLLAGGPPCQSFSLMGSKSSFADRRGMLIWKMVEFATEFKPKVILIEQVKGLLSAKGFDGKKGSALKQILNEISSLGYSVTYKTLRAADYGVAQLRDRVFIVGIYGKKEFFFPEPTHVDMQKNKQMTIENDHLPYRTVSDVISDLPAPTLKNEKELFPNHVDISPRRDVERITGVPEGECLARQLHLPQEQRLRLNPEKDTTKFRRLAFSKPALTLRGGEVFYHPTENRYLTPREYMRIHSFPDDHRLYGPVRGRCGSVRDLDQHRLVANAVPPLLAEAIVRTIADQLL